MADVLGTIDWFPTLALTWLGVAIIGEAVFAFMCGLLGYDFAEVGGLMIAILVWPAVLAILLVIGPFILLNTLGEWLRERRVVRP